MAAFYFLGAIIVLVINWIIAQEFSSIATDKGYDNNKYFWYCFLFGIVGYLLVIALPNRHSNTTASTPVNIPSNSKASAPAAPVHTGESGNTADAHVGLYRLKCSRCNTWQFKNTTCNKCGATFVNFIQT